MTKTTIFTILLFLFVIAAMIDGYRFFEGSDGFSESIAVETDIDYSSVFSVDIDSFGMAQTKERIKLRGKYLLIEYDIDNCIHPKYYHHYLEGNTNQRMPAYYPIVCYTGDCDVKYVLFNDLPSIHYTLYSVDIHGTARSVELHLYDNENVYSMSRLREMRFKYGMFQNIHVLKREKEKLSEGNFKVKYRGHRSSCLDFSFEIVKDKVEKPYIELGYVTQRGQGIGLEKVYNDKDFDEIFNELIDLEDYAVYNEMESQNEDVFGELVIEGKDFFAHYKLAASPANKLVQDYYHPILLEYFTK